MLLLHLLGCISSITRVQRAWQQVALRLRGLHPGAGGLHHAQALHLHLLLLLSGARGPEPGAARRDQRPLLPQLPQLLLHGQLPLPRPRRRFEGVRPLRVDAFEFPAERQPPLGARDSGEDVRRETRSTTAAAVVVVVVEALEQERRAGEGAVLGTSGSGRGGRGLGRGRAVEDP